MEERHVIKLFKQIIFVYMINLFIQSSTYLTRILYGEFYFLMKFST